MTKRLYVGKLPYSITDSQLEEMFSEVGKVASATVIMDREAGQSKGFGFVEMKTDKDAEKAIKELNDTEVGGKKIVVNVARPKEERPRFGGDRGGRRSF